MSASLPPKTHVSSIRLSAARPPGLAVAGGAEVVGELRRRALARAVGDRGLLRGRGGGAARRGAARAERASALPTRHSSRPALDAQERVLPRPARERVDLDAAHRLEPSPLGRAREHELRALLDRGQHLARVRDLAHASVVVEVAGHPRRPPGAPGQHLAAHRRDEERPAGLAARQDRRGGERHQQQQPAAPTRSSANAPAGSPPTRREKRNVTTTAHTPSGTPSARAAPATRKSAAGARGDERRPSTRPTSADHPRREPALGRRGLADQAVGGAAHQDRERGHARQDVAGQLGGGEREEGERQQQPEQHEAVGARLARRRADEAGDGEPRPGEEPGEQHRQVVPERPGVVVDRRREALEVVVQEEDVERSAGPGRAGSRRTRERDDREGDDAPGATAARAARRHSRVASR